MDAILAFHAIESSSSVLAYSAEDLRVLIGGLLDDGVAVVTLDELRRNPASSQHRVVLTFDDGFRSVHQNAVPVVREFGVPAVVYVVSEWVGKNNRWPGQPESIETFDLMTWSQLGDCLEAGFEVGCHTANHVYLGRLEGDRWEEELGASRGRLEQELGQRVKHFSYPYGSLSGEAVRQVGQRYETAVTTDLRYCEGYRERPHMLPRLDCYYLQRPARFRPLFGLRTRSYLKGRALLRKVRRWGKA
jgi:peptidoglycan/xylan/chitin deacetylase (PgdA/CDA1 family)